MEGHRVFETQDGSNSLFSERFGVSYHSKYGAWQETQHIFIQAGLRYALIDRDQIHVLDIGYGTGLNCLATLFHTLSRNIGLTYEAIEAYPVDNQTLERLAFAKTLDWNVDQATLEGQLHAQVWPSTWSPNGQTTINKRKQRIEDFQASEAFDVVYFDAFAPEAQPELWTPEIFARMYSALRPGGILVTYCAKGQVKRDMKSVGFTIERLAGPPGKREMTRATKPA